MDDEIVDVINQTVSATVNQTIIKLKKAGMMKDNSRSSFKKTEDLLYSYVAFKDVIACGQFNDKVVSKTRDIVNLVDSALDKIRDDEYVGLIEMIFFEDKTREECAEYFGVEPITITRNKNRLINILKNYLFSDEVIEELFLNK